MLSNRDKQLKLALGYRGKSYVRPDGSEVLLDKLDWDMRKRELWARAEGRCEYMVESGNSMHLGKGAWIHRMERCQREGVFPCHIEPRHPVRDDRLSNLKLGCVMCTPKHEKQNWRKTRFGEGGKAIEKRGRK